MVQQKETQFSSIRWQNLTSPMVIFKEAPEYKPKSKKDYIYRKRSKKNQKPQPATTSWTTAPLLAHNSTSQRLLSLRHPSSQGGKQEACVWGTNCSANLHKPPRPSMFSSRKLTFVFTEEKYYIKSLKKKQWTTTAQLTQLPLVWLWISHATIYSEGEILPHINKPTTKCVCVSIWEWGDASGQQFIWSAWL